jgi:hypothetical protein
VLAVEELEERDGVFTGDAGPLFEGSHVEALRLARGEQGAKAVNGGPVKYEIVVDAGEALFAKEAGQERAGARMLDAGLGEDLGDGGHGKTGVFEGSLDGGAGVRLIVF